MTTMADMALSFARLSAALGPCSHPDAVPLDLLVTGETVAWLCPACEVQLPAGWAASSAPPEFGPWFAARSHGVCDGCGKRYVTGDPVYRDAAGLGFCFGCGKEREAS